MKSSQPELAVSSRETTIGASALHGESDARPRTRLSTPQEETVSVPPNAMKAAMGAQAGAPPAPPTGAPQPPKAAGTATPQDKKGKEEAARVNVHIAMNMLEQALPVFGSESEEGKAVLSTLSSLSKKFGKKDASDLVPAEVMQMVKGLPQMGGGTDVQQMLQKQMQQPPSQPQGQ